MNMLVKYLFGAAWLLTATALAGCTKDSVADNDDSRMQIVPRAAFAGDGSIKPETSDGKRDTKAPADAAQNMTFYFLRADETSSGVYGSYGTTALDAVRDAGADVQALSFTDPQYYLTSGLKTKMVGWYPAETAFTGGVVSWTIDGSQDVMTAPRQAGSRNAVMPSFTFRHALAQICFYPYAISTDAAAQWGKITKITVSKQRTNCTFTPSADDATGKVVFSGDPTSALDVQNLSQAVLPVGADNATRFGDPMMIEPQTDGYYLRVTVSTEKMGDVSTLTPLRFYIKGSVTWLKLKFSVKDYVVEPVLMGIGDWVYSGNAGVGDAASSTYPYVLDGAYVVMKDARGSVATSNPTVKFHAPWTSYTAPSHNELSDDNAVSSKFEVAAVECGPTTIPGTMNPYVSWDDAKVYCAKYAQSSGATGTWRLPTKTEMERWFRLKDKLTGVGEYSGNFCWTLTEDSGNSINAWAYMAGGSSSKSKVSRYAVRCVRDVGSDVYPYFQDGTSIVMKDNYGEVAGVKFHDNWTTTPAHNELSDNNAFAHKFEVAAENCDKVNAPGVGDDEFYLWSEAIEVCSKYSQASGAAGTWRLPTREELRVLITYQHQLSGNFYTDELDGFYWAQTESSADNSKAWQCHFEYSDPFLKSEIGRVRCIRDVAVPTTAKTYPYVLNNTSIVTKDKDGALAGVKFHDRWLSTPAAAEAEDYNAVAPNFEVANADCNATNAPGVTPNRDTNLYQKVNVLTVCSKYSQAGGAAGVWRLPTVKELEAIYSIKNKLLIHDFLPAVYYWSVTIDSPGAFSEKYCVRMDDGTKAYYDFFTEFFPVRCVRDLGRYPYIQNGTYIVSKDAHGAASGPFHPKWTKTPQHNELSADNAVGEQFEVAADDCNEANSGQAPCATHGYYHWEEAIAACSGYHQASGAAGTWRLPTIKELQLIYSMKNALPNNFAQSYIASTEDSTSTSTMYFMYFSFFQDGVIDTRPKAPTYIYCHPVRCVRDL